MSDKKVTNDKVEHKTPTEAPVSHVDMAVRHDVAVATVPKPDAIKDGAVQFGHPDALYGSSEVKKSGAAEAQNLASPENHAAKVVERTEQPVSNDGAQAARDLKVQAGDKPPTRSEKLAFTPAELQGIDASKEKLMSATGSMDAGQKAEFTKHMDDLEHRLPPVTADQIEKVYNETTRLLTSDKNVPGLSTGERNRLANDIMSNAAQQHEIDQGFHNTCNVTTLEQTLNRTSPELAAKMVVDAATTGQFQAKDGFTSHLDVNSLHPDKEAIYNSDNPNKDGSRNYASQVFDMAAVNDYWQRQEPKGFYTQVQKTGQSDTGERLSYANGQEMKGPDGRPMREPGLGAEAMGQIGKSIGLTGDGYIISTKQFEHSDSSGGTGEKRVDNYESFRDAITKNPTSIIALNSGDKLFTGTNDKGGAGGGHVVTVSDFRKGPPDEVYMRNQWGSKENKWVSVADLYNASLPPDSGDRVGADGQKIGNRTDVPQSQPGDTSNSGAGNGGSGRTKAGDGGSTAPGDAGRPSAGEGASADAGYKGSGHIMTDDEFKKWKEEVKRDNPDDPKKIKQHGVDIQQLIEPLQKQLQEALAKGNPFEIEMLKSRIHELSGS